MVSRSEYKPPGHSSVSVYVMADEAQRVIKFAKTVFHAELLRKMERSDGRIRHAEFRIDDSIIMVADSTDEYPASPVWLHVYVPDVDETFARALEAGGVPVQEPSQQGDEDRRSGVRDPTGNVWWISTRLG